MIIDNNNKNKNKIQCLYTMSKSFTMKNLDPTKQILGKAHLSYGNGKLWLSQSKSL